MVIPWYFVDRRVPDCPAPLVASNNVMGGRMATEFLVRQQRCKTIYVVAAEGSQASVDRIRGHAEYMRERFGPDYTPLIENVPDPHPLSSRFYTPRLFGREFERLDRCLETRAHRHLLQRGMIAREIANLLKRPRYSKLRKKIHLVGFGGQEFIHSLDPPIASIRQNYSGLGQEAVRVVLQLIQRRKTAFGRALQQDYSLAAPVYYDLPRGGFRFLRFHDFAYRRGAVLLPGPKELREVALD